MRSRRSFPAMSKDALKGKSQTVRGWRLHLRTTHNMAELAEWMNPIIRGWMDYYGTFYRQEMRGLLLRINTYLVRWARRKFKRLRSSKKPGDGGVSSSEESQLSSLTGRGWQISEGWVRRAE